MRRIHVAAALLLTVPFLVAGCGRSAEDEPLTTVSGQLLSVDLQARTLTISSDRTSPGETQTLAFAYDDRTEVVGANGQIHALTGMDGARVTVAYRQTGSTRQAVRVEVSSPSVYDAPLVAPPAPAEAPAETPPPASDQPRDE